MLKLRELRKRTGITMKDLGEAVGLAESTISHYETGKRQPDYETLLKLGEFFGVSVDYLLIGEDTKKAPTLTKKDERDIEKKLADILADLESGQDGLMFSGESIDPTTRELLADSLRNSMEMGKKLAKQKYTPKKYRKED